MAHAHLSFAIQSFDLLSIAWCSTQNENIFWSQDEYDDEEVEKLISNECSCVCVCEVKPANEVDNAT